MSARSEFVADPVNFMRANIVVCSFDGGRALEESRPLVITIREWAGKRSSKPGGKVYRLSQTVAGLSRDEKVPIYWLAYNHNNFSQGNLNNQSRFMFTAQMNGCSLGFGSQSGDGCCLVSHANKSSAGKDGYVAQRDEQRNQLANRFGTAPKNVIEPSHYMGTTHGGNAFFATNFGVNVNGTWHFYTHRYLQNKYSKGSAMWYDKMSEVKTETFLHGGCVPAATILL